MAVDMEQLKKYLEIAQDKEFSPEEISEMEGLRETILDLSQKEFAKEKALEQILINIENALVKCGKLEASEVTFLK
ncbi:MAG: hypothetical protein WC779_05950 [Candidatus Omnitrophota bacterium]|jgi:hypothetical protein